MSAEFETLLLTVAERFQIENAGVVLVPDFPLHSGGGWKEYTFFVKIEHESIATSKYRAVGSPVHRLMRDPSISGGGWRLTIVLPGAKIENIPIGSKALCSAATFQRLFGIGSTSE